MNFQPTLTRSQRRLQELLSLDRPLDDEESEELYRALHADYMRKWRAAKLENDVNRHDLAISRPHELTLLERMREEARR